MVDRRSEIEGMSSICAIQPPPSLHFLHEELDLAFDHFLFH